MTLPMHERLHSHGAFTWASGRQGRASHAEAPKNATQQNKKYKVTLAGKADDVRKAKDVGLPRKAHLACVSMILHDGTRPADSNHMWYLYYLVLCRDNVVQTCATLHLLYIRPVFHPVAHFTGPSLTTRLLSHPLTSFSNQFSVLPVVPHKVAADVSKIGNL